MSAVKILIPTGPTVRILGTNPVFAAWCEIFHRIAAIPVKGCAPYDYHVDERTTLPVYLLDVTRLSPLEHSRLISYYWRRFDLTPDEARQIIAEQGVPLRADGVMLEAGNG